MPITPVVSKQGHVEIRGRYGFTLSQLRELVEEAERLGAAPSDKVEFLDSRKVLYPCSVRFAVPVMFVGEQP